MMVDKPMPDEPIYHEWITSRRAAEPSRDLADRVMTAVDERVADRAKCKRGVQHKRYVHLAERINESQPARWAACLAAMLVGCLPFLFVAYMAQSLVF